jgi:tetratricopeptide (TPR) repeat protein
MNRSFTRLRQAGVGRSIAVLILILLSIAGVAGCADINRLREAQNAFDQAAQAENTLRFHPVPGSEGSVTLAAAARAGYTSALTSLSKLSDADVQKLRQDKLWGNVLVLKAMAYWRLQNYAAALDTAQEALGLQPDDVHPRDKAILKALPGLIRIDQVYSFIAYKALGENESMLVDEFQTSVESPLVNAEEILETARAVVLPNEPVQIYLIQAQLAAYRNLKTAFRKFKPGRDTVPDSNPMKKRAEGNIQDLSDILLVMTDAKEQRAELIRYWLLLTGLRPPNSSCQKAEICSGG